MCLNLGNDELTLINNRINWLIKNFQSCIAVFEAGTNPNNDGPLIYFHKRCIESYNNFEEIVAENNRIHFLEYVYATLNGWGMHRPGNTRTKLNPFTSFSEWLNINIRSLQNVSKIHIVNLGIENGGVLHFNEGSEGLETIRTLINSTSFSQSNSQLVANTKLLHHYLPNLIVPIDRRYTIKFFNINGNLLNNENAIGGSLAVFNCLYPYIVKIAKECEEIITKLLKKPNRNPWHTSYTKIIDNAIMGAKSLKYGGIN